MLKKLRCDLCFCRFRQLSNHGGSLTRRRSIDGWVCAQSILTQVKKGESEVSNKTEEPRAESGVIRLRVIRILNDRELVVSGGSDAGLEEDDLLRILGPEVELRDPETGEDLGLLRTTKALVRIYNVAKKYALARTFRSRRVLVSGTPSRLGFGELFSPPKYETRTETLERDPDHDVSSEGAVEVGDPVEVWDGAVDDVPSVTAWT